MSEPTAISSPGTSSHSALPEVRTIRRNMRFRPEGELLPTSMATATGQTIAGAIANESFSGIGISIASSEGLAIGQPALVQYYGHPVCGVIRRIAARDDGSWEIGVEWK